MLTELRRSRKMAIAFIAVVAVAIVAAAALSGSFNFSGQKKYSTATVSGKVIGQAFTEGNAVGNVTAIYFGLNGQSQANQLPAKIKPDGSYSITLTNGMNYTALISVVDPNNNADTGVCQSQPVSLNDLHAASYVFNLTPYSCG